MSSSSTTFPRVPLDGPIESLKFKVEGEESYYDLMVHPFVGTNGNIIARFSPVPANPSDAEKSNYYEAYSMMDNVGVLHKLKIVKKNIGGTIIPSLSIL